MTTVVADANVLASGFVRTRVNAAPVLLLDAWRRRLYTLAFSEHIITELVHTFEDPYFQRRMTPEQMARDLALLRRQAILTPITVEVHGVATHPEGVRLISPRDFLTILLDA